VSNGADGTDGVAGAPRTGYPYLDAVLEQPGSVLALAHRGGAYHPEIEGLENTVTAFRHAVDLGYTYLETDVHVTRDGVLLAFHDAVLDRVTDRRGELSRLTAREAAEALIGGREQIPTLGRLMDEFPDARFNIDLKSEGAGIALADLVDARRAWDRVLVGSFSGRRLAEFRRRVSHPVATSATPRDIAAFLAVPTARAAAWLATRDFAAFQVPHRRRGLRIVGPGLVRRAHAAGKHVHVWTIDEPPQMHELLELGVDGLFTDRTDVLKDVLTARGQWWRGSPGGSGGVDDADRRDEGGESR